MTVDDLRNAVLRFGLKRKSEGAILISRTGQLHDWLLDLRPVLLQREMLAGIAAAFWEHYREHGRFQLAGMETTGIPLLAALLICAPEERGQVNGFIVRKKRKTTGRGSAIEGVVTEEPIVLVDDIISSAATAEKARMTIEMQGRKWPGVTRMESKSLHCSRLPTSLFGSRRSRGGIHNVIAVYGIRPSPAAIRISSFPSRLPC
jgi:hypothetical protein